LRPDGSQDNLIRIKDIPALEIDFTGCGGYGRHYSQGGGDRRQSRRRCRRTRVHDAGGDSGDDDESTTHL
ncbi:hypothetical protein E4U11_001050, partial [Claviceps purpurea]